MNKKLALLAAPVVMLAASAVTAENQWGFTTYLGADAQWRHTDFYNGLGHNLFRHDYPQGNVFAGVLFNEVIGLEIGFQSTTRKTKSTALRVGDTSAGVVAIPAISSQDIFHYQSTSQIKGPNINLVGYIPLSERYNLKAIGMVGYAYLKSTFVRSLTSVNTVLGNETGNEKDIFTGQKGVLRLGVGLQHMFAQNWGARAMINWENTNKICMRAKAPASPALTVNPKNSLSYGIGAFITF